MFIPKWGWQNVLLCGRLPVADLHRQILDAPLPSRSNFLHFQEKIVWIVGWCLLFGVRSPGISWISRWFNLILFSLNFFCVRRLNWLRRLNYIWTFIQKLKLFFFGAFYMMLSEKLKCYLQADLFFLKKYSISKVHFDWVIFVFTDIFYSFMSSVKWKYDKGHSHLQFIRCELFAT